LSRKKLHRREWNGWSLTEDELDAYIEEHPSPVHDGEATEESGQRSNIVEFPYQ
jgi:hypothetical protein